MTTAWPNRDRRSGPAVATLEGVTKTYDGVNVVDHVDLTLEAGRAAVLVGPNGCGKTTTVEMLIGLRRPSAGRATIAGIPVVPGGEHRFHVGVQLQTSGLPAKIKVREVIRAVACLYRDPADWRPFAERLRVDAFLGATVDNLSGGQRRRLDILCATLGRPSLLVLDEPTSGIDPEGRATVWDFIRSQSAAGCAVLATTHDMAEAEAFCDDLLVMADGRIRLRGSVEQMLAALDGDRRLRIMSPTPEASSLVRASGRPYGRSGDSLVVVGSAAQMEDLARSIDRAPGAGSMETRMGPVRLEDVFAIVVADSTSSRSRSDGPVPRPAALSGEEAA